jgi:hypothetical protein
MASSINASTTAGVVTTADTSGTLNIQTAGTTAIAIDASQAVTFTNSANLPNTFGFKNRIINGQMQIDQRNGGAEVNPATNAIYLDRWTARSSQASKFKIQQVTTAPTGFSNSLLITSLSAYSIVAADYFTIDQRIETANVIDFAWGTASGSPAVLSFWVRSSLTGTFTGAIAEYNSASATYGFSYTISVANTWEYKTVSIPCPTIGTWNTTLNGGYMTVTWGLGVGSNETTASNDSWLAVSKRAGTGGTSVVGTSGATWQVTGVQLEKGSTATSFDYRDYGRELIMCQRYYWKSLGAGNDSIGIAGYNLAGNAVWGQFGFPVTMRATPTVTVNGTWIASNTAQPTIRAASATNFLLQTVPPSTAAIATYPNSSDDFIDASSEL